MKEWWEINKVREYLSSIKEIRKQEEAKEGQDHGRGWVRTDMDMDMERVREIKRKRERE